MRIVGIEKEDIKRVIKSSTYGFDYVELQNGAKVIVNQSPILLGGFHDFDSYYDKCIFNYPMLEKLLDDGKGGIEFDDKKMTDYIAEHLIFPFVWDHRTPEEWAEGVISSHYKDHHYCACPATFADTLKESEGYLEQVPIEAFQNHPSLLREIKKGYSKQLDDKNKYVKASKSKYSKEELNWLISYLNSDVEKEEQLNKNIAKIEKQIGKTK